MGRPFGGLSMEIEVILMIASFLCGAFGMALAKKAKEKSSYPYLIASFAAAVLTFAGLVAAVVFTFIVK